MMRFGELLRPLNVKVDKIGGAGMATSKKPRVTRRKIGKLSPQYVDAVDVNPQKIEVPESKLGPLRDMELLAYHLESAYNLLALHKNADVFEALEFNNIDVYNPLKEINRRLLKGENH